MEQETIDKHELAFLHRFADRYSPETAGRPLLNRIDDIDIKFKSLFIGVEQMVKATKKYFPKIIDEA